MAKGKKNKPKKKPSPKKLFRKKANAKKVKSIKKKTTKVKAKSKLKKTAKLSKAKSAYGRKKPVQRKLKPVIKKKKSSKKEMGETKEKEKLSLAPLEIFHEKTADKSVPIQKPMNLKALAKAKEAILEKERQKHISLSFDKTALEKQMKLAEPKNKLVLEYIIHSSLSLLYEFITSPSGLSEWFADNVNIVGSVYSFLWDGAEQKAKVLSVKENKSVRFQWTDRPASSYFELRIEKNELTEELSLIITDFAETQDEINSLEVLWQGQVQRLMKVLGSKI